MKYKVISLYCIGRHRSFKKGDIVTAGDFADVESKVKGRFLVAVSDDETVTPPVEKEVGEEPRMTDAGESTFIQAQKETASIEETAPEVKASITEVNDSPSEDLKIKPAPNKGKRELKEI